MIRRFFKYSLIFFIFLFSVMFAFSLVIFFSPIALQRVLTFGANQILGDQAVCRFEIQEQQIHWPSKIIFKGVSFSLIQDENLYDIYFQNIQVSEFWNFLSSGEGITLQLTGGEFKASDFFLSRVNAYLVSQEIHKWEGLVFLKKIKGQEFQLTDVKTRIAINSQKVVFSELYAKAYAGELEGSLDISFSPEISYEVDVMFEGLDAEDMENLNFAVFSQVRGLLYGSGNIQGISRSVENIQIRAYLKDGGKIQARAFEPLLAYLPRSVEKKQIQQAIFDNRLIDVNDAQIYLASRGSEVVSTQIQLNSRQLNLDVNLTVDILVEGGLHHLLKYIIPISQFLKGE